MSEVIIPETMIACLFEGGSLGGQLGQWNVRNARWICVTEVDDEEGETKQMIAETYVPKVERGIVITRNGVMIARLAARHQMHRRRLQ